jgi:hypothetical protein
MTKARDISRYGLGVGIQSAGNVISGVGITQLNFIGAGNTFRVTGGTVDISISGGAGGVAINTAGGNVGYSITTLVFSGSGISTVTANSGISTINIVSPVQSKFSPVNFIIS